MKKAAEMGSDGIEFTDLITPADVSESSHAEMMKIEMSAWAARYQLHHQRKSAQRQRRLTQRSSVFAARLTWRRYSALSA